MPDVGTFKRGLAKNALRKTIDNVVVSDKRILGKFAAAAFVGRLRGAKLVAARRHGKHLLASIDRRGWLALHFGMTGAISSRGQIRNRHSPRVRLDFADDGSLAYTNKRMIRASAWSTMPPISLPPKSSGRTPLIGASTSRHSKRPCLASSVTSKRP